MRIFIRHHPGPLPEVTPQDVDAFVDHQYAQGLARLLGHTDLQTTQRYIDGADPQVRRSYEAAMARSLSPAETSMVAEGPPSAAPLSPLRQR